MFEFAEHLEQLVQLAQNKIYMKTNIDKNKIEEILTRGV